MADEFRDVIGRFATGVTIITARDAGVPYGTTASAVSSVSLEPPTVLVCLNKTSVTGGVVARTGRFGVNILDEDQVDLAARFATKGEGKFRGVRLDGDADDVPLLADALAMLDCRVREEAHAGTHTIFIAEVARATGRPGAPLAYFRGNFGRFTMEQNESAQR
jgi:flavin reductase (DIM6/NTAB) family NADH-FMN oxidoreductase RutF